ncbi:MAG: hypothetical protein A2Z25_16155 [Planctomycetes bacterium RBG_16_55_9]|nr:MAG: hypothetical protein A2Z25_16155 [Planctomycetes bacterium RBG_16_55_9]
MKRRLLISMLSFSLVIILAGMAGARDRGELSDLARIQTDVKTKRVSSYDQTGGNNDRFENIEDGQVKEIFNVKGAGIINHIWITIAPPPEQLNRNDIILRMYWDGNPFASVESPIGPFFGQGWNESYPFVSLPLAVGPTEGRALVSYFVMPFSNGARIEIENQTGRKISAFYYYVDYVEVKALQEDMGRFCAWYNHELTEALADGENEWSTLGPQGKNPSGDGNYLIADVKGKGHFVGVNYYVHCPTTMWYGEGDDMIFIDGDSKPTLHGTGTEDYFNTSWCPKTLYTHPYFGYVRVNDDMGWIGRTHVYRFHISDPLYFDKSLKFTIEHGHNNCLTLDLASVAYWYQAPPLTKLPADPDKMSRQPRRFIQPADIHKWRQEWRKSKGQDNQLWGNER